MGAQGLEAYLEESRGRIDAHRDLQSLPQHSARAKELLLTAPVGQIGAGIIPELQAQPWAKEVLDMWSADDALDQKVKRAIEPMDKGKPNGDLNFE